MTSTSPFATNEQNIMEAPSVSSSTRSTSTSLPKAVRTSITSPHSSRQESSASRSPVVTTGVQSSTNILKPLPADSERKNRHKRHGSATMSPSSVFPSSSFPREFTTPMMEQRGRRSSSTSSSASAAHLRTSIYQTARDAPPIKFAQPVNTAEIYDQMEKEQEALVNKLQREITDLKSERSRSRSQSTSSSASVSRNASVRSAYSISDAEDLGRNVGRLSRTSFSNSTSFEGEPVLVQSLKKENELLKKKLADLSIKLTEKETEIESLKNRTKEQD